MVLYWVLCSSLKVKRLKCTEMMQLFFVFQGNKILVKELCKKSVWRSRTDGKSVDVIILLSYWVFLPVRFPESFFFLISSSIFMNNYHFSGKGEQSTRSADCPQCTVQIVSVVINDSHFMLQKLLPINWYYWTEQ